MKPTYGLLYIFILSALHLNVFAQVAPTAQRSLPSWNNGHREVRAANSVAPLIQTQWGPGCFYNAFCPVDTAAHASCLHVAAGPGAVAMAQIMKYYNFPEHGTGEHGYPHPVYGIQYANFGSANYNWASMPPTLTTTNDALATAIYHCGVSQDMNFGTTTSTSFPDNVDSAFVKYFGYPKVSNWKARAGFTQSEWIALVKAELDASHPLLLADNHRRATKED